MKLKIITIIGYAGLAVWLIINSSTVFADQPKFNGKLKIAELSCSEICYTGKPYNSLLESYVFNHRNYNPVIARWTTPDPSGFPDGANNRIYAAVPNEQSDYQGLWTLDNGHNEADKVNLVGRQGWQDSKEAVCKTARQSTYLQASMFKTQIEANFDAGYYHSNGNPNFQKSDIHYGGILNGTVDIASQTLSALNGGAARDSITFDFTPAAGQTGTVVWFQYAEKKFGQNNSFQTWPLDNTAYNQADGNYGSFMWPWSGTGLEFKDSPALPAGLSAEGYFRAYTFIGIYHPGFGTTPASMTIYDTAVVWQFEME